MTGTPCIDALRRFRRAAFGFDEKLAVNLRAASVKTL